MLIVLEFLVAEIFVVVVGKYYHDDSYVPREAYENQPKPEKVDDESDLMNEFGKTIAYGLENRN
jgi:hypothetical protein